MSFSVNTMVPTPTGIKGAGELVVGDNVFDKNGWLTKIVDVGPLKTKSTVNFVTDSGQTLTVSVDHPVILSPYGNSVRASNVGRQPQPSIPVVGSGLVDSEFWGTNESRRKFINDAIEASTWKGLEGQSGVIFMAERYASDSPSLVQAITASGGIARAHRHPSKSAMVVTEDRSAVHRINRINVSGPQICRGVVTESGTILVTRGLIPVKADQV